MRCTGMLWMFGHKSNTLHASFKLTMRLAEYTDYTLRELMYCAAHRDERLTARAAPLPHGGVCAARRNEARDSPGGLARPLTPTQSSTSLLSC